MSGAVNIEGRLALLRTPLCPAGHLPRRGGDWQLRPPRAFCNVSDWRNESGRRISPLEGEMSGRTEGGAKGRRPSPFNPDGH